MRIKHLRDTSTAGHSRRKDLFTRPSHDSQVIRAIWPRPGTPTPGARTVRKPRVSR